MRRTPFLVSLIVLSLGFAEGATALDGWLSTRDAGLEAARGSGRPVLVVTIWKDGL